MRSIFVLLFCGLFLSLVFAKDRVKLSDVEVITLYKDKYTTGRRSQPVPQLKCVGGSAGSAAQPKVVQCYNRGFDGRDVQWECKAEMDGAYTFGEIEVVCEGYDYPDDPYILAGSCGLEYKIDYKPGYQGQHQQGHQDGYYSSKPKKNSFFADLVFYAIVAAFVYTIYRIFVNMSDASRGAAGGRGTGGGSDGYGGGPPPGGGAPPPPGFRPDYYSGDDSCNSNAYRSSYSHAGAAAGNRPGFWTGLGTGGLLGYMLGNRGGNTGYYNNRGGGFWGAGPSTPSFGGGGHTFGGGGGGGGARSTSGFGGTRRR